MKKKQKKNKANDFVFGSLIHILLKLPGLLYQLIRRDTGQLVNKAFTSNPIVSSKQ